MREPNFFPLRKIIPTPIDLVSHFRGPFSAQEETQKYLLFSLLTCQVERLLFSRKWRLIQIFCLVFSHEKSHLSVEKKENRKDLQLHFWILCKHWVGVDIIPSLNKMSKGNFVLRENDSLNNFFFCFISDGRFYAKLWTPRSSDSQVWGLTSTTQLWYRTVRRMENESFFPTKQLAFHSVGVVSIAKYTWLYTLHNARVISIAVLLYQYWLQV